MTKEEATRKIIEIKNSMMGAKGAGVKAFLQDCDYAINMITEFKYDENDKIFRLFVDSLSQKCNELNERLKERVD